MLLSQTAQAIDWLHIALGLATVLAPVIASLLTSRYGKDSAAAQVAQLLASAIALHGHPETQATVAAKASLAGLDDHPLVQHAAGDAASKGS